ncbi:hypothetical protein B296_00007466 [Ensete ventricosum]|uniref:Uncharacterized protein n=1 Tax=Ensete ventricosum TaxID=4639 RepID=A0A426Y8N9_ENSVE|nr:hypothetical protein B296_00007466 [Ensete ventricosum]
MFLQQTHKDRGQPAMARPSTGVVGHGQAPRRGDRLLLSSPTKGRPTAAKSPYKGAVGCCQGQQPLAGTTTCSAAPVSRNPNPSCPLSVGRRRPYIGNGRKCLPCGFGDNTSVGVVPVGVAYAHWWHTCGVVPAGSTSISIAPLQADCGRYPYGLVTCGRPCRGPAYRWPDRDRGWPPLQGPCLQVATPIHVAFATTNA